MSDLGSVLDMEAIRGANIRMGVDPLGGAGVHYWAQIAERYGLNLTVINEAVDPTFRFMTVDWDGQIRMDPSSPYAMERLIELKDRFDIAFACDTDHDRHGIVTRNAGLLPPNHYLSVVIFYLFQHRPKWRTEAAVGKTVVSSQMIDCITAKLGRKLYEVPVGFKWFVDGLLDGSLGFGGEESAARRLYVENRVRNFAARPSGTEDIYKIYAESFRGADHLRRILEEAQTIVNDAVAAAPRRPGLGSNTNVKEKR